MARYRLLSAHYFNTDSGVWLPGDKEQSDAGKGEEAGTIVGDGTPYEVQWPTLEMAALDPEAEAMLDRERERLRINDAEMNPVESLAMDSFEENYIPGSNRRRRPALPHGTPVKQTEAAQVKESAQ